MAFPVSARTTGVLVTATVWNGDLKDNLNNLYAGALAIASQAANDFLYASSTTQMGRVGAVKGIPFFTGAAWGVKGIATSAISIASNILTVDLLAGLSAEVFTFTMNANITTMTINNIPTTGNVGSFVLIMTANGSGYTWSWLTSTVKWPGSNAPTMTTTNAKADIYSFFTYDGGTTWFGSLIGQVYL